MPPDYDSEHLDEPYDGKERRSEIRREEDALVRRRVNQMWQDFYGSAQAKTGSVVHRLERVEGKQDEMLDRQNTSYRSILIAIAGAVAVQVFIGR